MAEPFLSRLKNAFSPMELEQSFDADSLWDTVDGEPTGVAKAASGPVGSNGVTTVGGYLVSTEREPLLNGPRRYEAFNRMLADTSIVAAGVRLFLNLLANADWTVNPAEGEEDNPQAKEYADLAYSMMFDMRTPWANMVRKVAMYRFHGFSVGERTMKVRDDGLIGVDDVGNRPQSTIVRWNLDPQGNVVSCWQRVEMATADVEMERDTLVYAVDDSLTDSPEGMGLFRNLMPSSIRLKAYQELEEIGFSTDLRGIPVAYGPLGDIEEEAKTKGKAWAARKMKPLVDFINGHMRNKQSGAVFDSATYRGLDDAQTPSSVKKWSLELLQGQSNSFSDINTAIIRINEELARVLGVEHLLLGAGGTGSLALAQSKVGTFYLTVTSTLLDLVEILERDWLQPIADMNGWPDELTPTIGVAEIRDQDINQVTTALLQMAQAGAILSPDDPAVGEVRDLLGLSRPDPTLDVSDAMLTEDKPSAVDLPADSAPLQKSVKWIKSRRAMRRAAMKRAA